MELKKSDKANLEKKSGLFFEIGLLIALGFVLLAFEFKVAPQVENTVDGRLGDDVGTEHIPITRPLEPPPPPPEPPKVTDILEIVDNDIFVANVHIDIDVDLMTVIPIYDFSETEYVPPHEELPFHIVEDKPLFDGRDAEVAFREWVNSRIMYPAIAVQNGIEGRVFTEFVINSNGFVVDIKITRGVDPTLDNEVLRVLRQSPRWTPGKQGNQPVMVRYQFPFIFRLQ